MKTVQLTENEVLGLCNKSRDIFLRQPILLELEAPLKICGEVFRSASATCTHGTPYNCHWENLKPCNFVIKAVFYCIH